MGCESQCVGHSYRSQTRTRETLPASAESERIDDVDVLVVDQRAEAVRSDPPGPARHLLNRGRAACYRRYPFTLILKAGERAEEPEPLRLKIDPGSKTTGLAVVNDATGQVVWAAELDPSRPASESPTRSAPRLSPEPPPAPHALPSRSVPQPTRSDGWLPPSLESRVANMLTWVERLRRLCPIGALSLELVKFDTQLMQNAEITGVEYQQGELAGYEVREYLLEKWGRKCAYCKATNVPLQIEHIVPKVRHGSNRVSNLTIACKPCNDAKGTRTAEEFGFPRPPDASQSALARRCGSECDALGALPPACRPRPAAGDGHRRTDQVEPRHARSAQDALA